MLKYFGTPFAASGGRTAVPAVDPGTGAVSYPTGWGPFYQLANTDPNSLNIDRQQTNQMFYDVTAELKLLQEHGVPDFITTALNGGVAHEYGVGDYVRYEVSAGVFRTFCSRVAANVDLPTVAASWRMVRDGLPTATAGGTANALTADFSPDLLTPQDGEPFLLQFASANTGAATLAVDGAGAVAIVKGADTALSANDILGANSWGLFVYDTSLNKYVLLNPAAGVGRVLSNGAGYLSKSGANLLYAPFKGNQVPINGRMETIPSAGVTLAPTSTAANTTYNVYAYMNAGTMTLEYSVTARATDATTGVEIKTGDATRSYVGKARTVAAGAWVDDATRIYVISWFNPKRKMGTAAFTANRTVATGAGFIEVNTEIRVFWLTHGVEPPQVSFTGGTFVTGAAVGSGYVGLDGSSIGTSWFNNTSLSTVSMAIFENGLAATEGDHYTTLIAASNSGTNAGFIGGANGQVSQQVVVQG